MYTSRATDDEICLGGEKRKTKTHQHTRARVPDTEFSTSHLRDEVTREDAGLSWKCCREVFVGDSDEIGGISSLPSGMEEYCLDSGGNRQVDLTI